MNELQRMRRETYFAVGVLVMGALCGLFAFVLWSAKRPRWGYRFMGKPALEIKSWRN